MPPKHKKQSPCGYCAVNTYGTASVLCSSCNFYHHQGCIPGFSDELYKNLVCAKEAVAGTSSAITWTCEKCVITTKKVESLITVLGRRIDDLEEGAEKTDEMVKVLTMEVGALKKKITIIEKNEKEMEKLRKKVSELEELKDKVSVENVHKRLTELEKLRENVKMVEEVNMNFKELEKLKENVGAMEDVKKRLTEVEDFEKNGKEGRATAMVFSELLERESRRGNLVIYGLTEPANEISDGRMRAAADQVKLQELVDFIGVKVSIKDEVKFCKRLGAKNEEKTRPLLVGLKKIQLKELILINARKLAKNDAWKNVYVNQDITRSQREGDVKTRQEADRKNREMDENESTNWLWKAVGRRGHLRLLKLRREEDTSVES